GGEQENLLTAHAVAGGVGSARIDREPGKGGPHQGWEPGEVVDLARVSPRVERQPPPLPVGRDDGEGTARWEVAPEAEVVGAVDPAPVRRDHQRDRRMVALSVPGR